MDLIATTKLLRKWGEDWSLPRRPSGNTSDSMLLLFEYITHSSSVSLEDIKSIAAVKWIFHVSDFFRLLMMSFKYGLILLKCSSTDSGLFLSPLLPYSRFLLLEKLPTPTGLY